MNIMRSLFAQSQALPQKMGEQQAGVLSQAGHAKTDAQKIFAHLCPPDELAISSKYLVQALE